MLLGQETTERGRLLEEIGWGGLHWTRVEGSREQ